MLKYIDVESRKEISEEEATGCEWLMVVNKVEMSEKTIHIHINKYANPVDLVLINEELSDGEAEKMMNLWFEEIKKSQQENRKAVNC